MVLLEMFFCLASTWLALQGCKELADMLDKSENVVKLGPKLGLQKLGNPQFWHGQLHAFVNPWLKLVRDFASAKSVIFHHFHGAFSGS